MNIRDLHVKYLGIPLTRLKLIDSKALCDQIMSKMKTWRARSLRSRLQLVIFVLYSVQKPYRHWYVKALYIDFIEMKIYGAKVALEEVCLPKTKPTQQMLI